MPSLYLLDANVFIDANRDYYPINRFPVFWKWLEAQGEEGLIKVPTEIFEEVANPPLYRHDEVSDWLNERKALFLLVEEVDPTLLTRVTERGYAENLTEDEQLKIGQDPFLIAYALADANIRVVVSNESSKPSRQRANRKVPDICIQEDINVRCINMYRLIRELDFHTDWGRDI